MSICVGCGASIPWQTHLWPWWWDQEPRMLEHRPQKSEAIGWLHSFIHSFMPHSRVYPSVHQAKSICARPWGWGVGISEPQDGVMSDPCQSQMCLQTIGVRGSTGLLNVHSPRADTLGTCPAQDESTDHWPGCQRHMARLPENVIGAVLRDGACGPIKSW